MMCFILTGMPDLVQDDQLVLIKSGFFEVWLTRMARMFNQMENYVTFEDGSMIHRDELSVVYAVSIAKGAITAMLILFAFLDFTFEKKQSSSLEMDSTKLDQVLLISENRDRKVSLRSVTIHSPCKGKSHQTTVYSPGQ